jgi:plasmid stabilization system protein ParE
MAQRHRRIVWTAQAQLALNEALDYIAQDSVDGARAVLTQALTTASGLATLSERGRLCPSSTIHWCARSLYFGIACSEVGVQRPRVNAQSLGRPADRPDWGSASKDFRHRFVAE